MFTSRIELLQCMPIFAGVREDTLQWLLGKAQECHISEGDYFFRQADEAMYMYVLESGQATVRKTWNEHELQLGTLSAGDCFGEMAVIDMSARSASVRAETDCIAIEISSINLHGICEYDAGQFAIIQMNINRELSRRLRMSDEKLMRVAVHESALEDELAWPKLFSV
ncbi:MAG: Crp/Fnr family transcriptional regulator [Leptothrix sp. (in: b-proteobacteria)]